MVRSVLIMLMTLGAQIWAQPARTDVQAQITFQNETVHLEMSGRRDWKYDVTRKGSKMDLEVESLDPESLRKLQAFKNRLVKSITVKKNHSAGRDLISFVMSGPEVEHFDYLTDEPSRLILDFYLNPEAKKAEKKVEPEAVPAPTAAKAQRGLASEVVTVDPNGVQALASNQANFGLFDGADPNFERFTIKDYEIREESIIKSRDRFYIHFPWLLRQPLRWHEVLSSGTVYQVNPKVTDENKQMRLLQKLFEKKRNRIFLQTVEWFHDKYPQSEYNEMIDFMKADVRWRLYQESGSLKDFDRAIQAYRETLQKNPKSPLYDKTSLLIAIRLYEKADYLAALRAFNQHIENKAAESSSSLSRELARLGVGLSYIHLKKFEEAEKVLRDVEKDTSYDDIREEAAYHLGDIFVVSKQYGRAIEEYESARKKYPKAQGRFPSSYFNKGEAQFWLGNFRKSLDDFREYVKRFPSDSHAPLALTRLGENLEILGADKSRVMGAYLETYFRYGDNLNSTIARIRMTAARMKGMKPKEVEVAAQEILELSKRVDFVDADKLATILISEGYNERGEYDKTIDLLVKYYQKNPTMSHADQFTKRIVANINEKFFQLVKKKEFIEGLKVHQKYSEVWLKNSDRLDTRFYLGRAFEFAGVPKESERYYREVLNRLLAVEGTNREREIRIVQDLPSKESLYLRLAEVQNNQGRLQDAYESLRQIKKIESLNEEEQIERVVLTTNLLTEKDQLDSARRFVMELLKTWRGEPSKLDRPYLKLGEIETKSGQFREALRSYKKIHEIYQDTKVSNDDIHFKSLERRLELAERLKDDNEMIEAATQMLEAYEQVRPVASIRYKLGKIYFKQGQTKKAEQVWSEFKGPQSDFWQKLAREQVQNLNWRDDYKKYINRIPAMSRDEGQN
ncbi:MAG: tetratricopeptide repeat protein [Bdellovibrionales bacterium]